MAEPVDGALPLDFHEVVWPRGRRTVVHRDLAPRLDTLAGKTIAFLWDSVFRGDEIFPILEAELGRRFPGARFVPWDTFGATFGGAEPRTIGALPDRLRRLRVDAVVSAVGC
jgi:hypothetical protein